MKTVMSSFFDYNRFYRMPKDCSNKKNSKIGVTYFTITMYSPLRLNLAPLLVTSLIIVSVPSTHPTIMQVEIATIGIMIMLLR